MFCFLGIFGRLGSTPAWAAQVTEIGSTRDIVAINRWIR
jgi:hypothetical protein